MSGPLFDLVPLWTIILGLGVFFYVLLDGSISASAFSTASRRTCPRAIW